MQAAMRPPRMLLTLVFIACSASLGVAQDAVLPTMATAATAAAAVPDAAADAAAAAATAAAAAAAASPLQDPYAGPAAAATAAAAQADVPLATAASAAITPASAVSTTNQYNVAGPCGSTGTRLFSGAMTMPAATGCTGTLCAVQVLVTAPASNTAAACVSQQGGASAPVVVFFSGFQGRASQYTTYVNRLASYGYAVVQYDTNSALTNPLTDAVELRFLDIILASLAANSTLTARINFNVVAVAGHSRGGKLAALHFANAARVPRFAAAYLVDPVDNTQFSPEGPSYPSASKALAALAPRRAAGVAAASITGSCNPAASNYQLFYSALAAPSWLTVVQGASHAAFQNNALGLLTCGSGSRSIAVTMAATATVMTAWMDFQIRGVTPMPTPTLQTWINGQVSSGVITFAVKA